MWYWIGGVLLWIILGLGAYALISFDPVSLDDPEDNNEL